MSLNCIIIKPRNIKLVRNLKSSYLYVGFVKVTLLEFDELRMDLTDEFRYWANSCYSHDNWENVNAGINL